MQLICLVAVPNNLLSFTVLTTNAAAIHGKGSAGIVQEVQMGGVSQGKLSRRRLIVAAFAAPMAGCAARGAHVATTPIEETPDPLIAKAASWVAASARIDAMSVEADELQGQVFDKARKLRIKGIKACRSRMPEARRYRALNRKITAGYHNLELLAGEISAMAAVSIEGALAKIELGLNVQGPFDWRDHALEIAESGIAELRQMTAAKSDALPLMSILRDRLEQPD